MKKNAAYVLAAVLFTLIEPAHAAIINTLYVLNHNLSMSGRPQQNVYLFGGDDYDGEFFQSSTTCIPSGSTGCSEVTTTARSSMIVSQDLDAGVISGSFSWAHSQSYDDESISVARENVQLWYDFTSPYRYSIEVSGSAVGTAQGPLSAGIQIEEDQALAIARQA